MSLSGQNKQRNATTFLLKIISKSSQTTKQTILYLCFAGRLERRVVFALAFEHWYAVPWAVSSRLCHVPSTKSMFFHYFSLIYLI